MIKIRKRLAGNVSRIMRALALLMVIQTANTACVWVAYQPKLPEAAYRFKKDK